MTEIASTIIPSGIPTSYAAFPGMMYIDPETKKPKVATPHSYRQPLSYIKRSPIHGMGGFASCDVLAGDFIEEVGIVILDTTTNTNKDWVISKFLFTWPCELNDPICKEHGKTFVVPTGNAMIYNHSDTPNSYWIYDKTMKRIFLAALRNISKDEELTWYYGHDYAQALRVPGASTGECSSCEQKRKDREAKAAETKITAAVLEEAINFRSMVVPEITLNDNIQEGTI